MFIAGVEISETSLENIVDDNVLYLFEDAEEIGSSDVSICVRNVISDIGGNWSTTSNEDFLKIRRYVQESIRSL